MQFIDTVGRSAHLRFIFMQYLGLCAFVGISERFETAIGMSGAVIFVMTFASTVAAV